VRPWFEKSPGLLEEELELLRTTGYSFTLNEVQRAAGRLVLNVKYDIDGEQHNLTVSFPDNYPYFPVEIYAPSFPSGPHKDPYTGLLCTLKEQLKTWSTRDTLAGFLATQVRKVFLEHQPDKTHMAEEGLAADEAAQATGYFPYRASTLVFTGPWAIPVEHRFGKLIIGLEEGNDPNKELRGAVLEVLDAAGNAIAKMDELLAKRYTKKISGRWARLNSPPAKASGDGIFEEALKVWPAIGKPRYKGAPDVVGLLFPEETQPKKYEDNWVFVVRYKKKAETKGYIARADRFSQESYQARVPRLSPIAGKKVLIVGLGAIGSNCAWQLARAGVGTLHLLDYDHVQLGNLPRWQLGLAAVGLSKTDALGQHLAYNYPFVEILGFTHRLGMFDDCKVLTQALEGVELILDATAEKCVSNFLSDLAKERGISYVWATGTPGSYGGAVGRVVPNKTEGCWKCYQHHLYDERFRNPPHEDLPEIQPVGCFHPTFTGTGFDMDHVSLAAVRLVISTLCSGQEGGYPDFDWDVGVVDLWDGKNTPIAPSWTKYTLTRHHNCKAHD